MHIVHIAGFAGLGGVERRLTEYVSEVDDSNEHTLIAIDPVPDVEKVLADSSCRYLVIRRPVRFDPSFPFRLALLVRRQSPDIVYCRGFTSALWVSLRPPFLGSIPYVRSEHGSLLFHGKFRMVIERFINWRFNNIVTVSNTMATEIHVRLGVPQKEIEVMRYGLPSDHRFEPRKLSRVEPATSGHPVIGSIANFHSWKNMICIVNAAPLILERYPGARFILVGGDVGSDIRERCKARVDQLDLEDSFEFTGQLADANQVLSTFDVFVLPSVIESFGAVVVEAMLAGVPVAATNNGAMSELIENGVSGVLVEPTETFDGGITTMVSPSTGLLEPALMTGPEALGSAVISMLDNLDDWTETAKAVQQEALKRFSFSDHQRRMEAFYRSVVQ